MSPIFSYLIIPLIIAMFLAVNMGGSGTGPSFSAAYGANIIKRRHIPWLFGIMVFLGAIIAGSETAQTIGKGIINSKLLNLELTSIILFSVSISLLIANVFGVPQSTSQSTVFAIMAPAIYLDKMNLNKIFVEIIPTWFILPILSFVIVLIIGKFIYNPLKKYFTINFNELGKHSILKAFVLIASLYVAFSIGSNNVANASGPIASMIINELSLVGNESDFLVIMLLSTLIIAPNFGIGSSIFGNKIVRKTGKEIISIGPLGAILVSVVTASLLITASITKGIPTSLVQLNIGAIMGLSIIKYGFRETLKNKSFRNVWIMWIISPIIAFTISLFLTIIASYIGLLTY